MHAPAGLHAAAPARVSFQRDVAPILWTMCISCHNGAEAKGGFDLTSAKTAFARGEDGTRIVAGSSSASLLFTRLKDGSMPPEGKIPARRFATWPCCRDGSTREPAGHDR